MNNLDSLMLATGVTVGFMIFGRVPILALPFWVVTGWLIMNFVGVKAISYCIKRAINPY